MSNSSFTDTDTDTNEFFSLVCEFDHKVSAHLAKATGEQGLKEAEHIEAELTRITDALTVMTGEAGDRVQALRAEVQEDAISRVISLLNSGTISIADITGRLSEQSNSVPTSIVASVVTAPAITNPPVLAPDSLPVANTAPIAAPIQTVLPPQVVSAPFKNPIQFIDPVSGLQWTGRGPVPKWFAALCVNGKTKEDFRVASPTVNPIKAGAKFCDPISGATWVGQGRMPNWLTALCVNGLTKEDFRIKEQAVAPVVDTAPVVDAAPVVDVTLVAPVVVETPAADLIGETTSFDASKFDFDDVKAPSQAEDDIGEFTADFQTMTGV